MDFYEEQANKLENAQNRRRREAPQNLYFWDAAETITLSTIMRYRTLSTTYNQINH